MSLFPPEIIAQIARSRRVLLAFRCTCVAFSTLIPAFPWIVHSSSSGEYRYKTHVYADGELVYGGPRTRAAAHVKARERLLIGNDSPITYEYFVITKHIGAIDHSTGIVTAVHVGMWHVLVSIPVTLPYTGEYAEHINDIIARTFTFVPANDAIATDICVKIRARPSEIVAVWH